MDARAEKTGRDVAAREMPRGEVPAAGARTARGRAAGARAAFSRLHVAVCASYLVGAVILTALGTQPVLVATSLLGALLCSLCCLGARTGLGQLRWQLPALAIVCLANPLFSHSGATELFRVGPLVVRLEALAFGLSMGAVLVATIVWLECAAAVLETDRVMELGGGVLPTVTLMLSMALQVVPQLLERSRGASAVLEACTAARVGGGTGDGRAAGVDRGFAEAAGRSSRQNALERGARLSGQLMGWAMEDSIERANVMRARGWQAGAARSTYVRERFDGRAAACECAVLLLFAASLASVIAVESGWQFYPTLPAISWQWGYVAPGLYMLAPALYRVHDGLSLARWEAAR